MTSEIKHVKIPIWLAAILMSLLLAVAGDTWRSVQAVKYEVAALKAALISKGLIDPGICSQKSDAQKLPDLESIAAVVYFHNFQEK